MIIIFICAKVVFPDDKVDTYTTMKTKKQPFDLKKIPYTIALIMLTTGASLILGFLSFGGMYALIPALSLAFAAFGLSVAYEGEIYLQNIKGALGKLLKSNYLHNHLGKEFLLELFPANTDEPDCPQFFKDYEKQLKLLAEFGHKKLNKDSKKIKKQTEKTLKDMEKWFALQLFSTEEQEDSPYASELHTWLAKDFLLKKLAKAKDIKKYPQIFVEYQELVQELAALTEQEKTEENTALITQLKEKLQQKEKWFAAQLRLAGKGKSTSPVEQDLQAWLAKEKNNPEWQKKFDKHQGRFTMAKVFSTFSAMFMGLGSTYLIVEAFSVIPWIAAIPFAVWPLAIVPMALVAGIAYGLLTYNTITDLITNDTLNKWYKKLRHDLSQGLTLRNVFIATMAFVLTGLAVALTICTAGTWWTVANNARPLFSWMSKMPAFIMGIFNPVITGISAVFFNIQNSAESLEMLDEATHAKTNVFKNMFQSIKKGFAHLRDTENWLQMLNPFRLILKLTITPLRILLFLGHLVSIALTADRMPGVPQIVAALIAIVSEGFEDAHYFIGQAPHQAKSEMTTKELLEEHLDSDSGHSHDADIPTRILKALVAPLYALAALWDYLTSKINHSDKQRKVLDLKQAWNKQSGTKEATNVTLPNGAEHRPSEKWQEEHTISLLEKYEKKHLSKAVVNAPIAKAKIQGLHELRKEIRNPQGKSLAAILETAKENAVYNKHRMFAQKNQPTATQEFLEELPNRVNLVV